MGKDLKGKELGPGISQKNNGDYMARFVNKSGVRVSKILKTKREARIWLAEAKYKDEHGTVIHGESPSVDAWFEYWFANIKKGSYNTRQLYKNRYDKRVRPVIGNMLVKDVRMLHCQNVINLAQDKGDASSSLAKIKTVMSQMFESAVENCLIESNPVTRNIRYQRTKPAEKYVLTKAEQEAFCKAAKDSVHGNEFVLALNTGLRCGEIMALKWSDIDWEHSILNVTGTMYFDREAGIFCEKPPKTAHGLRKIPLTDRAMAILREQKRIRDKKAVISFEYSKYVFLNRDNKPTQQQVYNRSLTALAKQLQLPHISMHCLRHTFATRCIEAGMKPKVLQEILGHADITMTMNLYVHVTEDEKVSEMKKLMAYL